eukprot:c33677_g1_i1.p1 GENE.c33677_g1_i1~~c33677_g1_i1.p1  ORF type:complete len:102 (+),score=39.35 c33677_g1_i1:33-308(+)
MSTSPLLLNKLKSRIMEFKSQIDELKHRTETATSTKQKEICAKQFKEAQRQFLNLLEIFNAVVEFEKVEGQVVVKFSNNEGVQQVIGKTIL